MRAAPHQQSFVSNPLAQLASAFAIGILASQFSSFLPLLLPLLLIAALLSIIAVVTLLKNWLSLATISLTLTMLFLGASFALWEKRNVPANSLKRLLDGGIVAVGEPVELTGVIDRSLEYAPESVYLTLRVESIRFKGSDSKASGVVALMIPASATTADAYKILELRYGARLQVMTTLNRADRYRNKGVSAFTEYLDRKGYDATGFVKSPLLIERLDDDRVFLPLAWLYEWRRKVEQRIYANFSAQTAGVLDAALLGNRYGLSRATAERFRVGGTFHVLVISGLHISFIGAVVFLLARRITHKPTLQFVLTTALLWGYTFAVGAEVSVVRAAFMFTFVSFAPIVARRAASLNALGAAALLLLVRHPSDLLDPSFQLTFLSVAAIVTLAWPLLERVSAIGSWRPTRETPCPPSPGWLRHFSELLFWSELRWQKELSQLTYSYRLFKTPLAVSLERYHLQPVMRYTFAAVVVSAGVQITLLPLLIIYFHRLSVISVVLNIGVSLMMAALSIIAIVGLIVALVSNTLAAPLLGLANALNWLMIHSIDPFAELGVASVRLPEYSGWPSSIYALYYVPLVILATLLLRWNPVAPVQLQIKRRGREVRWLRIAVLTQVFLLFLVVAHPLSAARPDGQLHVDFLDVGQGDSALVTMPDGTTLLVDAGGRPDFWRRSDDREEEEFARDTRPIGEAIVSEYLWARGLDTVDYLLATHADADHMDGLNDVAQNFRVRAALVARIPKTDLEYSKFAQTMESQAIPLTLIGAGDTLRFGDVVATVLWPPANGSPAATSRNNDSVVLRLRFGERTILLTGDIEGGAEDALVKRVRSQESEVRNQKSEVRSQESEVGSQGSEDARSFADLRADVVKVAHHGSKTSSTEHFVRAVQARFAIISVGQKSMFGHPSRDVVERWKASGSQVLITGKTGTITVTTDGTALTIETFVR